MDNVIAIRENKRVPWTGINYKQFSISIRSNNINIQLDSYLQYVTHRILSWKLKLISVMTYDEYMLSSLINIVLT